MKDAFYFLLIWVVIVAFSAWIGGFIGSSNGYGGYDRENPSDIDLYNANSIF